MARKRRRFTADFKKRVARSLESRALQGRPADTHTQPQTMVGVLFPALNETRDALRDTAW